MAPRKPFLLRIDPALLADLEAWAQDELRSVNGQIEFILKQAVQKRRGAKSEGRGRKSEPSKGEDSPKQPAAEGIAQPTGESEGKNPPIPSGDSPPSPTEPPAEPRGQPS